MTSRSALYTGSVMHRRLRPKVHRLRYRLFWMLLDLDEIDTVAARLRLFSRNRFNFFSLYDRDLGDGSAAPLAAQLRHKLAAAGLGEAGSRIAVLTMPRILGYAFNPISVYFCHRPDETLAAILYEVNNTFGQRHGYLIPVEDSAGGMVVQKCAKQLYVSPFMGMDMAYGFRVLPPGDRLALHITGSDAQGPLIFAAFSGARRPLTDATLLHAFVVYPLLTLKVTLGIHWEALLLWLKGVRLQTRPEPPQRPVTVVGGARNAPHHAN